MTLDLETGHVDLAGDLSSFFMSTRQWAWLMVLNERTVDIGTALFAHFSGSLAFVCVSSPNKRAFNLGPGELFMALHMCPAKNPIGAGSPDISALWWPGVEDMEGLCPSWAPLALGRRDRAQPDGDWLALSDTWDSQDNGHTWR